MLKITNDCIGCGTCENECPVSAISIDDDKATIDQNACIGCENCLANCPVQAITKE